MAVQDENVGTVVAYKRLHQVRRAKAQVTCDACKFTWTKGAKCASCGVGEVDFNGENCLEDFCRWLFSEHHRGFHAIAHNAKAYDLQFILAWLVRKGLVPKKAIMRGTKLIQLQAEGITFFDSLSFLPYGLAQLAEMFNVEAGKKGFFPYIFYTKENEHYVGPWPPSEVYEPQYMKPKQRREFFQFYDTVKESTFDMQKELGEYLEADVAILRQVYMLHFREKLHESRRRPGSLSQLHYRRLLSQSFSTSVSPPVQISRAPRLRLRSGREAE